MAASGIQQMMDAYKRKFRVPENLNFYDKADYRKAERQFVKLALRYGTDGWTPLLCRER